MSPVAIVESVSSCNSGKCLQLLLKRLTRMLPVEQRQILRRESRRSDNVFVQKPDNDLKFQTTGQCEQALRMNGSGWKTWLKRRCVVQNQGGLESQEPGGFGSSTWRNLEQWFSTGDKLFCWLPKGSRRILNKDQDGKEHSKTIQQEHRSQWSSI